MGVTDKSGTGTTGAPRRAPTSLFERVQQSSCAERADVHAMAVSVGGRKQGVQDGLLDGIGGSGESGVMKSDSHSEPSIVVCQSVRNRQWASHDCRPKTQRKCLRSRIRCRRLPGRVRRRHGAQSACIDVATKARPSRSQPRSAHAWDADVALPEWRRDVAEQRADGISTDAQFFSATIVGLNQCSHRPAAIAIGQLAR